MAKKKPWVKKRHTFFKKFLHLILLIPLKIKYRFKRDKFKIKKNKSYIVVCNHVTTLDPIFLNLAFNKMLYYVGSDDLFNIKYLSWWLQFITGIIPKSKGRSDIQTVKTMLKVLKEGGTVAVFPEGNRTYSGELCYISPAITKFFKKTNVPIIIYNINGGYGVDPRWANKKRKGHLAFNIKRILEPAEYKDLTDDELHNLILEELSVNDMQSGNLFKSKNKAENIERVLFRCPECMSINTIESQKNEFKCTKCHTTWEYNENLTITKDKELYKLPYVKDWYNEQIKYILEYDVDTRDVIFEDTNVEIYSFTSGKIKNLIGYGTIKLYKDHLEFNTDTETINYNISDMEGVSVAGKSGLLFRIGDTAFKVRDNKKLRHNFNSLKYVLMINHIKNQGKEDQQEFLGI